MDINRETDAPIKKVTAFIAKSDRSAQADISYTDTRLIGNGSFGVVYRAKLIGTNEFIAIKKMVQEDKRDLAISKENRELYIMRNLDHQNIVELKYYFYSKGPGPNDNFLNLVLEYVPDTVYRLYKSYRNRELPMLLVKLYSYQMFRALSYFHSMGYCHRDIKPQNLLVYPETGVLKLCDFGSSKFLMKNEKNVAYICSRYYRAPELIFGSSKYNHTIDIWSAGCVLGELIIGKPIFVGDTAIDQLVEIIRILGTPTSEQIRLMNPTFANSCFPKVKGQTLQKYLNGRGMPEAINLLSSLLEYAPNSRRSPISACAHPFFDELRNPNCCLPSGRPLPPLFNFSRRELGVDPTLIDKLIPQHVVGIRELVESEFDVSLREAIEKKQI